MWRSAVLAGKPSVLAVGKRALALPRIPLGSEQSSARAWPPQFFPRAPTLALRIPLAWPPGEMGTGGLRLTFGWLAAMDFPAFGDATGKQATL